jgi:flagellar protein FlaG
MTIDALTSVTAAPSGGTAMGAKVATPPPAAAEVEKLTPVPQPQVQIQDLTAAVRAAARQIDSYLKSVGRELEFSIDEATGRTVITVRMTATGEVIRQIPNEEVLELARHVDTGSSALLSLTA